MTLTTLEARSAMRFCGLHPIYTNKHTGYAGRRRRVKAYMSDWADIKALKKLVGEDNVTVTEGWDGRAGVVVACDLA